MSTYDMLIAKGEKKGKQEAKKKRTLKIILSTRYPPYKKNQPLIDKFILLVDIF